MNMILCGKLCRQVKTNLVLALYVRRFVLPKESNELIGFNGHVKKEVQA